MVEMDPARGPALLEAKYTFGSAETYARLFSAETERVRLVQAFSEGNQRQLRQAQ